MGNISINPDRVKLRGRFFFEHTAASTQQLWFSQGQFFHNVQVTDDDSFLGVQYHPALCRWSAVHLNLAALSLISEPWQSLTTHTAVCPGPKQTQSGLKCFCLFQQVSCGLCGAATPLSHMVYEHRISSVFKHVTVSCKALIFSLFGECSSVQRTGTLRSRASAQLCPLTSLRALWNLTDSELQYFWNSSRTHGFKVHARTVLSNTKPPAFHLQTAMLKMNSASVVSVHKQLIWIVCTFFILFLFQACSFRIYTHYLLFLVRSKQHLHLRIYVVSELHQNVGTITLSRVEWKCNF